MADDDKNSGLASQVLDLLPHRYPFLLVDKVLEIGEERVLAVKNVSFNEPFFSGHFPGNPVMPGVLIVESMAQAGALLALKSVGNDGRRLFVLTGLDKVRFRRRVVPGDQLTIEVKLLKFRRPLWRMTGEARVGSEVAAEAELSAMEVEEEAS